jgi:hypothetical protein
LSDKYHHDSSLTNQHPDERPTPSPAPSDSPAVPPAPNDAEKFFAALFDPQHIVMIRLVETWTEIDPKGGPGRKRSEIFRGLSDPWPARAIPRALPMLLRAAARHRGNVFFGVCPRPDLHVKTRGGRETFDCAFQIRIVVTLWADLDHCPPDEAVERCRAAGLPRPSIIVSSGNGTHLYWLL